MDRRSFLQKTSAAGVLTLLTPTGFVQALRHPAETGLALSFENPPASARPQVVWHWMNGNVTKEGITLDLEAMQRVGIGGFVNFDAGTGIPKGPVVYLSPEWLALKQHTIREAQRLGLEFAMHNCPGWSSSGGPWITPELAMQELTWSEAHVVGGRRQAAPLHLPQPLTRLDYYRDVVVLAFPALAGEGALTTLLAKASSSSGPVAVGQLDGSQPAGLVVRPAQAGQAGWLLLEFKQPYEATSLTVNSMVAVDEQQGRGQEGFMAAVAPTFFLEASDDGAQFRRVASFDARGTAADDKLVAAQFPAVRAKYFRLSSSQSRHYAQLRLSGASALADWQQKANFAFGWSDVEGGEAPQAVTPGSVIDLNAVVDLTARVDKQGVLTWQAPAGNWTILRLGFTPMGTLNRSAPDTGVGLECDKYSQAAVAFHFDKMMASLLPALGPLAQQGGVGLEIDSYEVGMQNWTSQFPQEFAQRRGYDLLKYLPAMTGRIVGSPEVSNRFLYDVRRAQGDLIADYYYGAFTDLCHQHGITSYMQPYDRGPMEEMQIGARGDLNMGEFWNGLSTVFQNNLTMRRTVKLAASIAHVNGRKVAAAEAFTGEPESARWQEYPFAMKPLADKNFALGLNRLFFHRFAHQPHPTAVPGMTMGPWGIHFERTTTWWEPGRAWLLYLARCQRLLQQGLFVADFAYFTGEQANQYTKVERYELNPPPPEGYDYDLLPAEALLKRARCERGRLVLADGMSYRVLVLQQYLGVSLAVVRKLRELVSQGLTVVGARPAHSLGVRDQGSEAEFQQLVTDLWGPANGPAVTDHSLGQGRVYWGKPLLALLASLPLAPDFEVSSRSGDAPLTYIHRRIADADVYFVANQRRTTEDVVCTFRVAGKLPEVWDATTGHTMPAPLFAAVAGGRTSVALQLAPAASVFVVFRAAAPSRQLQAVLRNQVPLLAATSFPSAPRQLFAGVTNNFTIDLWAKPEINVMLTTRGVMEKVADPWTDFYAIYPPPGEALYGEKHATCGLTVGRNGVAVWEHGAGKPVLVLAAPASLAGWSHVALQYQEGVPAVYLNGQLLATGTASRAIVHPGVGPAYLREGASFFYGDMSTPQLSQGPLGAAAIRERAAQPRPKKPAQPAVELTGKGAAQLLFWQDGQYQLRDSEGRATTLPITGTGQPETLTGPWQVSFPPRLGAPARITLPALQSLHMHSQSGVKYFSGTATYTKTVTIAASRLAAGKRLYVDLGEVEIIAEVRLNGQDLGILWTRPYRVDITAAARVGANQLEIRVTNQWPNRLIGDEQLPDPDKFTPGGGASGFQSLVNGAIEQLPDWYQQGQPKPDNGRVTFTTWKHYNKDSPLLEAGLLGPVRLLSAVAHALPA